MSAEPRRSPDPKLLPAGPQPVRSDLITTEGLRPREEVVAPDAFELPVGADLSRTEGCRHESAPAPGANHVAATAGQEGRSCTTSTPTRVSSPGPVPHQEKTARQHAPGRQDRREGALARPGGAAEEHAVSLPDLQLQAAEERFRAAARRSGQILRREQERRSARPLRPPWCCGPRPLSAARW